MSVPADLQERYLSWTILQRSCELAVLADELGDATLAALFTAAAQRAAGRVDASPALVERIRRDLARSLRSPSS
jgi:hypothetical protein